MIIKKIKLRNIRSYENAEINLQDGSTLLAGDIGSGKTSVLLAIEFALFGLQPGQKGASLLRTGQQEGYISLEIEIEGKSIIIERTLKRAKSVSQEYAAISMNGEKKEVSITELKNIILSLLNYPQEFAKKTNLLYRFTVYTPQEDMKQIILEDTESRLNTLRHIFGIDKYKRIRENTETFTEKLRGEIRNKQGLIQDLDEKKGKKEIKIKEIEKLDAFLLNAEKEFSSFKENRKKIELELLEIEKKVEEKKKLENEIEKTKVLLAGKKEIFSSTSLEEEKLSKQIEEAKKISFNELDIEKFEKEKQELRKIEEDNSKKNLSILSQISSLQLKSSDSDKLKNNIARMQFCPTCLQNVPVEYKANIINKLDTESVQNKKEISKLMEEKSILEKEISIIKKQTQEKEEKISELKFLEIKLESLKEKILKVEDLKKQKSFLQKDFDMLTKHIENLKSNISELSVYDRFYIKKESELEEAEKQEKEAEIKLAEIKKEISLTKKEIQEINKEIEKKEEIKKKLIYISELEDWLSNSFLEIVSFTEKNVMLKLKEEFSKLFNEWFNMLVPEIFSVSLDDNFTPIIEQQDYEIDYSFLSGGERTAIALAYRLSLNQTINSLLSRIKTRDIVILDEPTDGFSEQQLDKMRDVLLQLKVKQLILVSHEAKIESFVENIIKFRKESGITRVEA